MGYNIAGLPAYTDQQSKVLITRAILGAATIALMTSFGSFDPTAKGSEAIQILDTDVVIQDGSTCGRNPMGGAILTQAILAVHPMKINQNYCVKDLEKTWAVQELKAKMAGLPYTDALFLDDIGNLNSDKTALKLEQMIWQGDKTLSDVSLKQIDGFIKQIKALAGHIDLNPGGVNTALSTIAKLRKVDTQMPIEVTNKPDYFVMIGQDMEKLYLAELADKNLFVPPGSDVIFGTNTKYKAVPGLNGTKIIVAARVRNLQGGGEMTEAKFKKYYSPETEQTYFDSNFSLGVVPVLPEEIGLGDYNA